jgi:UDP-glucose 4-epimerase
MISKALITHYLFLLPGGAALLGHIIAQELIALGANVTIIDDLSTGSMANIHHIKINIRLFTLQLQINTHAYRQQGTKLIFTWQHWFRFPNL